MKQRQSTTRILYKLAVHTGATEIVDELQPHIDQADKEAEERKLWNAPTECRCGKQAEPHQYQEPHSPYEIRTGFMCDSCGHSSYRSIYSMFTEDVYTVRARMLDKNIADAYLLKK